VDEMIMKLADAPREKRIEAINNRIQILLNQSETERLDSLTSLIMSVAELPDDKRRQFIVDRTACIAQLPSSQLSSLMSSRAKLSLKIPRNVNNEDMKQTFVTVKELSKDIREAFVQEIRRAYKDANIPLPDFEHAK
jgi:hypothetical protein